MVLVNPHYLYSRLSLSTKTQRLCEREMEEKEKMGEKSISERVSKMIWVCEGLGFRSNYPKSFLSLMISM